ncbi:MAG TPA: LamG domain-containing protein [Gemmataceae bacterium]|nr:LamG domain-containing protein [Gemmataceae bacterium]
MARLPVLTLLLVLGSVGLPADPALRAGAAAVDVTPERFPVVVNCGFVEATGTAARDRLHARALVLDDGTTRLAVVIVDNCMMPREFLDPVKDLIAAETKIPADRQLIAATHTHTAPSVMGCLGSDPDPVYAEFLRRQLVRAVQQAAANLAPARAGWAVVDAGPLTNNRQWILRSDKTRADPFGDMTVRSNMHPGYLNPDFVGPSGPTDPWLSVLSVQTADGKPLAVLSNFSMHYFGSAPVSADYFGRVCADVERRVGGGHKGFVALHSQGTAGDLHWMDYGKPEANPGLEKYAGLVADKVVEAVGRVTYKSDISLAMAETKLTLGRRVPDAARLAWAQKIVAGLNGAKPKTQPEIYAREAVLLAADPRRELKVQAVRIGDLGIAAIPNEVFALTGLKIKAQSPLRPTFNIELANGSEGYIPPAEQHPLGGYTTWPARSAGLEAGAEAATTEAVLSLLERVADKKRLPHPDPYTGPYPERVLGAKPVRYWRLGDLAGPAVAERTRDGAATAEPGVVFGLGGPVAPQFDGPAAVNRAAHFAGGRVVAKVPDLGRRYTVEAWIWNGFPAAARDWAGTLFTLAAGDELVDALALGGTKGTANALAALGSAGDPVVGKTPAAFRTWNHAALVRDGDRVRVYLNGKLEAEADAPRTVIPDTLVIGGRPDRRVGWEGRLAEVAVYPRALTDVDLARRGALGK